VSNLSGRGSKADYLAWNQDTCRFESCHPDQYLLLSTVAVRSADYRLIWVRFLDEQPTTRERMVRDIIANDVAAGFDFRFPLQFASRLDSGQRLLSAGTAVRFRSRRPPIAAGGRYAASYAAHASSSLARDSICVSSPIGRGRKLKISDSVGSNPA
jgi:hypothetical protein